MRCLRSRTQRVDASKFVNPHFKFPGGLIELWMRRMTCSDGYLVEVGANAVRVFVNSSQLSSLAVLGARKSNTGPSGVDVHPNRRIAFLDYFK
jgi:hypothetical protein